MQQKTKPASNFRQRWVRWHLDATTAALWQMEAERTLKSLGIQIEWEELGGAIASPSTNEVSSDTGHWDLQARVPPAAFVVGMHPSTFEVVVGGIAELRQLCDCWSYDALEQHELTRRTTFLIGWFPNADHQAIGIAREMDSIWSSIIRPASRPHSSRSLAMAIDDREPYRSS